jgi:hypothetical protein
VALYWRWRTFEGMSLGDAWKSLGMEPAVAKAALDASEDSGLVPPELFSRLLARSRANYIDHNHNISVVEIAPTPSTELPDRVEVGFDPKTLVYQPRPGWRARLTQLVEFPSNTAGGFLADLSMYWRKRTKEGKSLQEAWAELSMSRNNAETSLHRNHEHRGMIAPELIGRVVARSRGSSTDSNEEVSGIILYPELTT